MSKKLLSLALAVVMVALAIPAAVLPAFAADVVESGGASSYFTAADDIVAYKDGYTTTGQIFEYAQENWEIGGLSVTDPKAGYYTANTTLRMVPLPVTVLVQTTSRRSRRAPASI